MIKLGNLAAWQYLLKNEPFKIPASKSGRVTLEFNSPDRVGIWFYPLIEKEAKDGTLVTHVETKNDPTFLCYVEGYETLQFTNLKHMAIIGDADFALKTNAGFKPSYLEYVATDSFTKIIERRSMSPDAIAISQQAKIRELQHQQDMQKLIDRMGSVENAVKANSEPKGDTSNDEPSTASGQNTDGGASTQTATTPPEGHGDQANE